MRARGSQRRPCRLLPDAWPRGHGRQSFGQWAQHSEGPPGARESVRPDARSGTARRQPPLGGLGHTHGPGRRPASTSSSLIVPHRRSVPITRSLPSPAPGSIVHSLSLRPLRTRQGWGPTGLLCLTVAKTALENKCMSGGEEETYFATKCAVRRYILKPKLTNRRENPDTALSVDAEEWPSGVSATVRRMRHPWVTRRPEADPRI